MSRPALLFCACRFGFRVLVKIDTQQSAGAIAPVDRSILRPLLHALCPWPKKIPGGSFDPPGTISTGLGALRILSGGAAAGVVVPRGSAPDQGMLLGRYFVDFDQARAGR